MKGAGAAGHVAIDGKRLRGSAVGDVPGVHLLAAFSERKRRLGSAFRSRA